MNIAGLVEGIATATAADLAGVVSGELEGLGSAEIRGIEALADSQEGDLTFVGDARHAKRWSESKATVALVGRDLDLGEWDRTRRAVVRVDDADQAMIAVLEALETATSSLADHPAPGRHPSAVIDETAKIADDAAIGSGVVVGPRVVVGGGVLIDAGVRLYADAAVGDRCHLHANVVVRER
ncbi:MAG: LpxD N-terminal domain-containing protein, partial [Planctomycetota bacterium]|nr:LpxD N-terminal domain-containing protein [Planctomycetota bacterium]